MEFESSHLSVKKSKIWLNLKRLDNTSEETLIPNLRLPLPPGVPTPYFLGPPFATS